MMWQMLLPAASPRAEPAVVLLPRASLCTVCACQQHGMHDSTSSVAWHDCSCCVCAQRAGVAVPQLEVLHAAPPPSAPPGRVRQLKDYLPMVDDYWDLPAGPYEDMPTM